MVFGTDGIRGKPQEYPLTEGLLYSLGKVLVKKWEKVRVPAFIIGKDTRRSCDLLAKPLIQGICDNGGSVKDVGVVTTPGLAYLAGYHDYNGGIMLTASHNPATDNGVKLFNGSGEKITRSEEKSIEQELASEVILSVIPSYSAELKPVSARSYQKHLLKGSTLSGLHIVLDCANGASSYLAPDIFKKTGAKVSVLSAKPDGLNINEGCGALFPEKVSSYIGGHHADFGVSFDGDCDRSIFIDEKGEVIDGDALLYLISIYLREQDLLNKDTIVATEYSNLALNHLLQKKGISVIRESCGDRNVYYTMKEKGLSFGGENSGHLIFRDFATTGDGILSALMIAKIVRHYGMPLSRLVEDFKPYPQVLRSYPVASKIPLDSLENTTACISHIQESLGRVLIRYSGTEPKVRILVEGQDEVQLAKAVDRIYSTMKEEISCKQ